MDLRNEPDWHAAGQELITGLYSLDDQEQRIALLESVCHALGDKLYPAFLQILQTIDEHAEDAARQVMAATLVDCLQMGRLPAGKLSAWGSTGTSGDTSFGQSRRLGPIEFVCAWYSQPTNETPISQLQFTRIVSSLLSLVSSDESAKKLYCHKLSADSADPLSGALSSRTRHGIGELADYWARSSDEPTRQLAIDAFLSAIQQESLLHQISQRPFT